MRAYETNYIVKDRVPANELAILDRAFLVARGKLLRQLSEPGIDYAMARLNSAFLKSRLPRLFGIEAKRCKRTIEALNDRASEARTWISKGEINLVANAVCEVAAGKTNREH